MDGRTYAKGVVSDASVIAQELNDMLEARSGGALTRDNGLACMMIGVAIMKGTNCTKETLLTIVGSLYDRALVVPEPSKN